MNLIKLADKKRERIAKRQMFEQLFDDFYTNRGKVYKVNFFRGLFFGFGSVLGGTVFVAVVVWILSALANWTPFIGDVIRAIVKMVEA